MRTTLELRVDGNKLEMGDTRISLDLINPIFNELSDYSLPFTIPVTEKNLETLGIEHDISVYIPSTTFENAALIIGDIILNGSLMIESTGPDNYISAIFYSDRSAFFVKVKGKYLTDLIYSETIVAAPDDYCYNATWLAKITDSAYHFYPDYNYVFAPVWMPNFGSENLSGKVEPEIVNKWDMENNTFHYPTESGVSSSHFAPYFYLCFVLKKLFELEGYILSIENSFSDYFMPSKDELNKMYINLKAHDAGNFADDDYWSSSESNASDCWKQDFSDGTQFDESKATSHRVRACRSFISGHIYALRDTGPGGGLIFDIIDNLDETFTYFESAPEDQSTSHIWSNIENVEVVTGTAVGTGTDNTDAIIAQEGHTDSGALHCNELTVDSFVNDANELNDSSELRKLIVFHTNLEFCRMEKADFSKHLPHLLITDFIRILEQKLNIRFIFSRHNNTIKLNFIKTILDQDPGLDITQIADPSSKLSIERYNGFEIPTEVNSEVEGDSEKLFAMDTLDNLVFDQIVENFRDLVAGTIGDLALVKNSNEIYSYDWDGEFPLVMEWILLGTSFIKMKQDGSNVLNLDQDSKDLVMYSPVSDNVKYVPRCDEERILKLYMIPRKQEYEDLTLLFYRGMVPYESVEAYTDLPGSPTEGDTYYVYDDDETYIYQSAIWVPASTVSKIGNLGDMNINAYPLLSNAMYFKINETAAPQNDFYPPFPDSDHSLSLYGDKGLYEKYFEKYIYWMLNIIKKETRKLHIDQSFLSNFEWDIMITIRNQRYFISRIPMEIDFKNQNIKFKECELLSL